MKRQWRCAWAGVMVALVVGPAWADSARVMQEDESAPAAQSDASTTTDAPAKARRKQAKPDLAGPRAGDGARRGEAFQEGKGRRGEQVHAVMAQLNLTEQQKDQVRAILAENLQKRRAVQGEIGKLQADAKAARDTGDEAAAEAIETQIRTLRTSMPGPKETLERLRNVLSAEQQVQFDAAMAAQQATRQSRRGAMKDTSRKDRMSASPDGKKTEKQREGRSEKRGAGKKQLDI